MPPTEIDNYSIVDELGRGGMAVVYRARDRRLGREVALKLLHEQVANQPEYRERLEREARAVAKLSHPNILKVYDCADPEAERGYIITELIDGPTLRSFVERRGFREPAVVALLGIVLAEALEHAHAQGVIHRDIKPENVMVDARGVPRLTDFGLARLLDGTRLTMTGSLLGSPAHMAPEVIEGQVSDHLSDLFALGTTLYFAATGKLPFDGANPAVVLNAILHGRYADPQALNPTLDDDLADCIRTLLKTVPHERPANAGEVARTLRSLLNRYGFSEPHSALRTFFEDPDTLETQTREAQQQFWREQADQALDQGRLAQALRATDRLLAWDPADETALQVLSGIQRRERTRTVVKSTVSLIAVVVTAALAAHWLTSDEAPPAVAPSEAPSAIAAAAERVEASSTSALDRATEANETLVLRERMATAIDATRLTVLQALHSGDARLEEPSQDPPPPPRESRPVARPAPRLPTQVPSAEPTVDEPSESTPVEAPRLANVSFRVWPLTATVAVDGIELGGARAVMDNGAHVAVGRRVFTARVEGLGTEARAVVDVREGRQNTVTLEVPWPPARVLVQSRSSAMVLLDGRPAGRTRQSIEVPITGRGTTRRISVRVIREGEFGPPWEEEVLVRTGEELVVSVPF